MGEEFSIVGARQHCKLTGSFTPQVIIRHALSDNKTLSPDIYLEMNSFPLYKPFLTNETLQSSRNAISLYNIQMRHSLSSNK